MEETSRISAVFIAAMFMTSIIAAATPSPLDLPNGEVTMTTDRACYFPGELVYIVATGWAIVPTIGDFPSIFWAITNETDDPVFETRNMLDATGSFNGTLNGTWDQKYRFFADEPPSGEQVPSGIYTIWFYELPGQHELDIEVVPAEIMIGDCPTEVIADAGGPYDVGEGEPVLFNASGSEGPWGASLEYRWDFDGDEIWDTSFSDSPTATHTWSDDYNGTAYVEVKSSAAVPVTIEIIGNLDNYTQVDVWSQQAQSFIATFEKITHVTVDVSRFANIIPDYPLVLSVRSDLLSPDLTSVAVSGESMPGHMVENWVLFDIPDVLVTPKNLYYIVLTSLTSNTAYEPHVTMDVYPDGSQWVSGFCGIWIESADTDLRMIISGTGGEVSATAEALVMVHNLAPTIDALPSTVNLYEGDPLQLSMNAMDPGSDDLTVTWAWEMGLTQVTVYSNDGSFPFTITDSSNHTYGDDGTFVVNLSVEDDDGGSVTQEVTIFVTNVAPSLSFEVIPSGEESDTLAFQIQATDPGSDDIAYVWWGHCSGWSESPVLFPSNPETVPDPYPSPDLKPRDVTDTQLVVCGDDGTFKWSVEVGDDDGGVTTLNGSFHVGNLPPSLKVSPPSLVLIYEGASVTLEATASDSGSDDLTIIWSWDYGPTETTVFYNDGTGPDPPNSPEGTFPFVASDSSTHTYGDDCVCGVGLTVKDDDGGEVTYATTVEVQNLAPELDADITAQAKGDLTLRVAGEKWHDVTLKLFDGEEEIASAYVLRVPGNPDEQSVTIEEVTINPLENDISAVVEYTPEDDPINGKKNGANPAWLIFTPHDGGEGTRLHHTFNYKHPETWIWVVEDFNAFLVGANITFEAFASDPGSDDLTFTWKWGDETSDEHVYYNNGESPDPFPSPEVNPIEVVDMAVHRYGVKGSYTITLIVGDDDSAVVEISFDVTI